METQVQIPDSLYHEATRLAAESEMSFADLVRRGLEEMIRHHPPGRAQADDWELPPAYDLGEALAAEKDWTALCHE